MTLDDIRLKLEAAFEVAPCEPGSTAPTGEPFDEIQVRAFSEEDAAVQLMVRVAEYAAGREGRLYWRIKPEALHQGDVWHARCRLLISDHARAEVSF